MTQNPDKLEALFDAVTQLAPDARAAFLAEACGNDSDLRRQVERLVRNLERAGNFLTQGDNASANQKLPQILEGQRPGDKIGRYKLLQQIGEGGCGVVYMAEQEEPVRRRLALKIIKLGMDTKNVIARFEAERQALALMDHPNIAKVYDAGATETGRPYFVMELVRGTKITDYCDEKNLSTQHRLDLFIHVCQAIQHAHQKGIIHRDIKPSNILVTVNDGVAVPKVIDFGIAKATTDQRLTDKTLFTAFEQFIGTPAYMSPEQTEITSVDVDTRSDIYSLGVLLYELLTGKTPFDPKELLQAGLDEMRRTIREKEPARPSTRISTLGIDELTTTAKRRGIEPPRLANVLRGDLDWIVMKCLEKDRARRYETANGLAMEIQRHLSNEPVLACPPSNFYRLHKMVHRNKIAFGATTAVVAALVIGLAIALWQSIEKTRAYNQAQTEAARNQEAAQILQKMLENVAPSIPSVTNRTSANDMLLKLSDWYRKRAEQGDAASQNILGLLYLQGEGLSRDPAKAAFWFRKAADQGFATAQSNLGFLFERGIGVTRDFTEAAKWYRKGADQGYAGAQHNLGTLYCRGEGVAKDLAEAAKWHRKAADQGFAWGQNELARLYQRGEGLAKDAAEAVRWFRRAADQGNAEGQVCLGLAYLDGEGVAKDAAEALNWLRKAAEQGYAPAECNLGFVFEYGDGVNKDLAEAARWYRKAADRGSATAENNLGALYRRGAGVTQDAAEAVKWFRKAADKGEVNARRNLAEMYERGEGVTKDPTEALKWRQKAIESGDTTELNNLAWFLATWPDATLRDGRSAVTYAEKAVAATSRTNANWLDTLAAAYAEEGDFVKAVTVQKEAMALLSTEAEKNDHASRMKLYESKTAYRQSE